MFRLLITLLMLASCTGLNPGSKLCDFTAAQKNIAWANMVEALVEQSPDAKYYYDVAADGESLTFWDYGDVCRVYPDPSKRKDARYDVLDNEIGIEVQKESLVVTEIFGVVFLP